MTELMKTLVKSYGNADCQNFLRKSWEKATENLRKTKNFRQTYDRNLAILRQSS